MLKTATEYLEAGLCILPAVRVEKRPAVSRWKQFQQELPTETHLRTWFAQPQNGICIVCGKVSGNLEMLDFDGKGVLFEPWKELIDDKLLDRLVIERSPSGGMHVIYRCESEVNGNMKLARRDGNTLIETRGEGGLFLCAPTASYELIQGSFDSIPVLTDPERKILVEAAW